MAKKVEERPALPNFLARGGDPFAAFASYSSAIGTRLASTFLDYGYRLNQSLNKDGLERMEGPLPLKASATGDLPAAADFEGALLYNSTTGSLAYSDGTTWVVATTNPLGSDLDTGGFDIVLSDGSENGRLSSDGTLVLQGVDVGAKLAWFHPLSDFGAVGDGVTDDTSAVAAAIAANVPLDWGSGSYRIVSERVFTVTGELNWWSNGATLVYDPAAHTYSCMTITLPDGLHQIRGGFTVDVGQNANVGLKFVPEVNGTDYPDLLLEDVTVTGAYRTSSFVDGDGILVVGSFRTVDMVRPKILDCHMATGAGVAGVYGIFGITISRNSVYAAEATTLRDVWIDKIYSDDPSYTSDQDAIRIFSRYGGSGTGGLNNPASGKVLGGYIRDVRGRSVKMQTEQGLISGLTLHRTTAANNGSAGALTQNADIEVQSGGCTVSDIEFQYDGFVPVRVLRCIQADDTVRWASPHIVSNIRGVVSGANSPDSVVMFSVQTSATAIELQCLASNINVVAETAFSEVVAITTLSGVSSVIVDALLANCLCPIDTSFLRVSDNATPKYASIINVTNPRGSSVPLVNVTNTLTLRFQNLRNITHNDITVRAVETFTVEPTNDYYILTRNSTTQTVTLPSPADNAGRRLTFKNLGSVQVDSASSNVQPLGSLTAGTAMFASSTSGTWISMISDGTDWVVMSAG